MAHNHDGGLDRRQALECMPGAGTAVVQTFVRGRIGKWLSVGDVVYSPTPTNLAVTDSDLV